MSKIATTKSKRRRAAAGRLRGKVAEPAAKAVKVTPVRLEPALRQGLEMLQGVLKTTLNKLVNQAVGDFIRKRSAEIETDLEGVLKQVKAYRERDPKFREAIRMTVEAEAQALKEGLRDPAQGTTYLIPEGEAGPARSRMRTLLSSK
jgi:predicted transcriptional regulator